MAKSTSTIRRNCFLAIAVVFASIAVVAPLGRSHWVEATLQLNSAYYPSPFEWIDNHNIAILDLDISFTGKAPDVLSVVRVLTEGNLGELPTASPGIISCPPQWTTDPDYGDAIYLRAYSGWVSLGHGDMGTPRMVKSVDSHGKRSITLQTSKSVIGCVNDETVVMFDDQQTPLINKPLLINSWKEGAGRVANLATVKFPSEAMVQSSAVSPDGRYVAFQLYRPRSNLSDRLQSILDR